MSVSLLISSLDQRFINDHNLTEYLQNNEHFRIKEFLRENDREDSIIGLICVYRYRIDLKYHLIDHRWIILSDDIHEEEKKRLNNDLEDVHLSVNLDLKQQIQLIIYSFDKSFAELKSNSEGSQSILNEEKKTIKGLNPLTYEDLFSKLSPIIEVDQEIIDSPSPSLSFPSNQKFALLTPTTRTRHDSSCSSTNSIKYTKFVPPSTKSVCGRRVIQSIHLRVQRKKSLLEKLSKKCAIEPTLYRLGLEFLRLYDGKFTYPQGHTFVIVFENKRWFLTIDQLKYVECQLNQVEPRSVVVLQYKNQFTTVQNSISFKIRLFIQEK